SALVRRARGDERESRAMLIEEIDGVSASQHPMTPFLVEAGFVSGAMGMQLRARASAVGHRPDAGGETVDIAERQAGAVGRRVRPAQRRAFKSTVSSPFARRYFEDADSSDSDD